MNAKSIATVAAVSEDEFKDYIGPGAYKLMKARQDALDGKSICNSSTLMILIFIVPFVIFYWLGYHKWWSKFFVIALTTAAINILMFAFEASFTAIYLTFACIFIFLAARLPVEYVVFVSGKIKALKDAEPDVQRQTKLLQRAGGTSVFQGICAISAVIIFDLFLVLMFLPSDVSSSNQTTLQMQEDRRVAAAILSEAPICSSELALADVKKMVEESPESYIVNMKVFGIDDIEETSYDPDTGFRSCEGTLLTNGGKFLVTYTYQMRPNGEYWAEAYLSDLSEGEVLP